MRKNENLLIHPEVTSLHTLQSVLSESTLIEHSYHSIKTFMKHVQSRCGGQTLNEPNPTENEFNCMLTAQKAILL